MEKKKFNFGLFITVLVIAGSLNTLSTFTYIEMINFKTNKTLFKLEYQKHSIIPMYKYKTFNQDYNCVYITHTNHTSLHADQPEQEV